MKKNILKIGIAAAMAVAFIPVTSVKADDTYDDTDAWNEKCKQENIQTAEQFNACKAYTESIAAKTPSMQAELDSINAQKDTIAANIAAYQDELDTYQSNVDTLNASISTLETQRNALQTQIDETQATVEQKQKDLDAAQKVIDDMSAKVKERIVNAQKTVRVDNRLDILLGAKNLADFLRVASALSDISSKEKSENEKLVKAMDELHATQQTLLDTKSELEAEQEELKKQEADIQAQKETVLVEQYKVQVIQTAAHQQEADLLAQSNSIVSNIDDVHATMNSISSSLDALQDSIFNPKPTPTPDPGTDPGTDPTPTPTPEPDSPATDTWYRPVDGGYRSAGTWDYPDGGIHFGYDFAVPVGTTVHAVGPGVVLNSVSGCPYGHLGDMCGGPNGAASGGNQVQLLCVVGGSLYGVVYYHMSDGSPVAAGTIVQAGDYVGLSGSSGSSTGPHCHVEIIYLGDGSNFAEYARTWNGDVSFGTTWWGYGRRCDHGYDAPCRMRPEDIYGY